MKYAILFIGLGITAVSLLGMVAFHEFAVSQITFLLGMIVVGIAYAKLHPEEKPKINTDQINKNIQNYNDLLWGKEKEEDPEEIVTITVKTRRKP